MDRRRSTSSRRTRALLAGVLSVCVAAWAHASDLSEQLRQLSEQHGFELKGIANIDADASARSVSGTLYEQLEMLLDDYNHVVFNDDGVVSRVIVSSRKQLSANQPLERVIKTRRQGVHHVVDATIVGADRSAIPVVLLLDTGASTVVLPESMIESLGYEAGQLDEQTVKTASGTIKARSAVLDSVDVGGANASDVQVIFLPNANGAEVKLLGMSFLDRFLLTIDDGNSEIILTPVR